MSTTESSGVRRLREARERAAARTDPEPAETVPVVQAGDEIHGLDSGGIILPRTTSAFGGQPGLQLFRGDTVTVQSSWIEASRNGAGELTWPKLVHDAEEQIRRWGRVRLAPGPFPADAERTEPGTAEHREAREQARQTAWKEPDPHRRAEALRRVLERFGPAETTSVTLSAAPDPSIRQAEEQRARLDASGPRFFMEVHAREAGVTGERR